VMRGSIHGASSRALDCSDHGDVFYKRLILCNLQDKLCRRNIRSDL
jgi:hypothetical protein